MQVLIFYISFFVDIFADALYTEGEKGGAKMYHIDYHLHSHHSYDGYERVADICAAALERGRDEIAITDHLDILMGKPYDSILALDANFAEIAAAREQFSGRLVVKTGVELGQPQVNPPEAQKFYQAYQPDFIIGSIHNMENDIDLCDYPWESLDAFEIYSRYLDWLTVLAKEYDFDVMGHLTYPLRYIFDVTEKRLPMDGYLDRFRELFRILIERGKGIECNTSGFFQKINDSLPPLELLKLYRECGGEIITVGSDAHRLKDVSTTVPQGEALLREAGFRYISTFTQRNVEFHPL